MFANINQNVCILKHSITSYLIRLPEIKNTSITVIEWVNQLVKLINIALIGINTILKLKVILLPCIKLPDGTRIYTMIQCTLLMRDDN